MSLFLRDYLTIVWFGLAAVLLAGLLLGVAALVRPSHPSKAKLTAYESGVDPVGSGWSQSQVRYYVFALLFVIFDVEAVFIFPWAAAMERYGWFGLIAMLIFIVLLLDGLVYAWKRGLLRWV
jgi:NADH-quinone oxidoreductase subunit A